MRKQYHLRPSPVGLRAWDIDRLVTLAALLKPELIPLTEIRELDEAYWSTGYDKLLTCREIAEHARLIQEVDLAFPVILSANGRVMDGMHRIAKAFLLGQAHVTAVRFPIDPEPDYTGVHPNDLPYGESKAERSDA